MPEPTETTFYNVPGQRSAADFAAPRAAEDSFSGAPPELDPRPRPGRRSKAERGLPGWLAVIVLIAIAGVGGIIDSVSGSDIKGGFNYGLVIASIVAILVVKRSQMFSVVIAPPLVYFVASAGLLYFRTGGLHNRGKLIDAATNWIVYGFPAIAGATAAVLLIAGVRLVIRK